MEEYPIKFFQNNKFYVYLYLHSYKSINGDIGTPYYVGKGSDKRAYCKSKGIYPPKDFSKIQIISKNMIEEDAFNLEKYLIQLYGRIDLKTGCLRNKTNGGDGQSGRICSTKSRAKISSSKKGTIPWNKGKTKIYTTKTLAKMSETHTGKKRKPFSVETRAKISAIHIGKHHSEKTKEKMSLAKRGIIPWNKVKKQTNK